MADTTISKGDTVYSEHGQCAEFVAQVGSQYVVRPIYESEDDDVGDLGDPVTWNAVFRAPPTPKLDAETAAAEKRLAEARARLRERESAIRTFERDEKARLDRIKRHDMLADLDRYLAGELTHYVATHDYYPSVEVIPLGETLADYSSASGYGVLTLRPSRSWDKKVHWSVYYKSKDRNRYTETKTVIPCCGEQAAQEKAREVVRAYLEKYAGIEPSKRSYAEHLVASCQKFGVEVPQWLTDGIAATKRDQLQRQVDEHRSKLAAAEAALQLIAPTEGRAA